MTDGVTITATTAQALLGSDNFKFAVGALGLGFFGGLLTWWFAAVRKRKRKERELEELRIGAHIVTEAEGLVSSGSGSASTGQPEETGVTETSELEDSGEVVSELLDSLKEEPVVVAPTMGDVTTDDSSTATLPLDETGVVGETSVLDDETSEQTSILDEDTAEQTSVLEDEEHTSVLDEETSEQTSVLDEENAEKTSVLAEETEVLADEKPKAKKRKPRRRKND